MCIYTLCVLGGISNDVNAERATRPVQSVSPAPVTHSERQDMQPASQAARSDPGARSAAGSVIFGPFVSVQVNVDEFGDNIVRIHTGILE